MHELKAMLKICDFAGQSENEMIEMVFVTGGVIGKQVK